MTTTNRTELRAAVETACQAMIVARETLGLHPLDLGIEHVDVLRPLQAAIDTARADVDAAPVPRHLPVLHVRRFSYRPTILAALRGSLALHPRFASVAHLDGC